MVNIAKLLTEHIDIWTAAESEKKSGRGRASGNGGSVYGVKKLRELILELAVRGKLVPQNNQNTSDNFKFAKLGDIVEVLDSLRKPVTKQDRVEGPYPYYGASGIVDFVSNYIFDEPLVLVGEDGAKWGAGESTAFMIEGKTWVNNHAHVLRPNREIVTDKFLTYCLVAMDLNEFITGMTVPKLNQARLVSIKIPLPPIAEQHRIVAKVDELMTLCDQLEQQHSNAQEAHETLVSQLLATLTQSQNTAEFNANWQRIYAHFDVLFTTEASIDALKQTMLQLAVMGKLVPQDPNDEPASELLKRIQTEKAKLIAEGKLKKEKQVAPIGEDEKPFELPKGWEWVRLAEIIKISSGDGLTAANMVTEGGIPVFGGNGINGYHNQTNVQKETLVIGRVGYYCGSIHITPNKAWVTDNAFITQFSESNIALDFLFWLLKITNLKENDNATAQPVISGAKIYPIVVALPPLAEQHRIVTKVDALMALCDQLKNSIQQANQQQQAIADALVAQTVVES